jgi:hypothetical protein
VGIRRKRKIATEPQLVCNRAITIDSLKFDIRPTKITSLIEPEMKGLLAVQLSRRIKLLFILVRLRLYPAWHTSKQSTNLQL